jgi:hypothetical protein
MIDFKLCDIVSSRLNEVFDCDGDGRERPIIDSIQAERGTSTASRSSIN